MFSFKSLPVIHSARKGNEKGIKDSAIARIMPLTSELRHKVTMERPVPRLTVFKCVVVPTSLARMGNEFRAVRIDALKG